MQCIGRTQSGARCRNDAKLVTCAKHRWQPLVVSTTSLALAAGLFQDVVKPIYDRLTQASSPSSWYVGSWRIDIERTVACIPEEAEISSEQLSQLRSLFAQTRVEIGPTAGRMQGPSGFYSREHRGNVVTEQEVLSVVDFTVTAMSDAVAVPTLVEPSGKRIGAGTPSMSVIQRTPDGIFIEGDGITTRTSTQYPDGTQSLTEKAYNMRIHLVRLAP